MTVADDGRGFDQAGTRPGAGSHLGILGMRERASLLDGRCEVLSTPGEGTVVTATVPLRRAAGRSRLADAAVGLVGRGAVSAERSQAQLTRAARPRQ
jgi:signal transduction histidine kinase